MHKSQIFFYVLASFIGGVFIASFFTLSALAVSILAIFGIGVIAISFNNKLGLLFGFLILIFATGMARFNYFDSSYSRLNDIIGEEVVLNGYINSEPVIDGNRARFVFRVGDENILITVNAFPRREFGEQISVSGKLELPTNFTLPGGQADFDYITYLKKDGIRTILFYPKIEDGSVNLNWQKSLGVSVYKYIFVIKDKFEYAINLSVSEPNAAFINGILFGTRQNIPDDLKDAFSKTGTTHILAISGYNIMIISEAVLLGLVWFFRRRVAFWISVVIIILFVILTGASASVVRAAVMGLILSFAHGYGRLYDQKNSIILAGAVMVFCNPMVLVFDIGFQLSFAAVLGLIYLYPQLEYRIKKVSNWVPILFSTKSKLQNRGSSISQSSQDDLREIGSGLKELTLMTLSAQIAVSPLLVYYFGGLSFLSLPTNILILPFVPVAMFLGFMTGIVGLIYIPAGQVVGYLAWAVTTYQIWIVEYSARLI